MPQISVLICDGVRVENNGKLIAIGIYDSGFSAPEFPIRGELTALFSIQGYEPGEHQINLQIQTKSAKKTITGNLVHHSFHVEEFEFTKRFFLEGVPIELDEPGQFEFYGSIDDEPLHLIEAMPCIEA